ncbi:MAG: ParA family protein [Thiohalomonadales bacterium]
MRTISIINTKGGCGKTTTAINLACCLGWKGLRVLLVDMDPQGHATLGVNYQSENEPGLYELFTDQASIEELIVKFVVAGIDIIPATKTLERIEKFSSNGQWQYSLANNLKSISYLYDYVVIDCPSMFNHCTTYSLFASNEIIIPLDMSLFSFHSLKPVIENIIDFENRNGVALPYSLLPTMVDQRTKLARSFIKQLWEEYPRHVLPFIIHNTVRIREAICKGIPIIDYDADSRAATDYMYLADQVIKQEHEKCVTENDFYEEKESEVQIVA